MVLLSRGGRRGEPPHRRGIVDCGHFLFLFLYVRKAAIFFAIFFLAGKLFIYEFFLFLFFLRLEY